MFADIIGWMASVVLIVTVCRQVWKQWSDHSTEGVSQWLFIGQMTASAGFLVYSWLLGNVIFTVSNGVLLLAALTGQLLYWRNRKQENARGQPSRRAGKPPQERVAESSSRISGTR